VSEKNCATCANYRYGECIDKELSCIGNHGVGYYISRHARLRRADTKDTCGPEGFRWKRRSLIARLIAAVKEQ